MSALLEVARRLEALLAARLGAEPDEPGVVHPLLPGADEQALAAVRAAVGGSVGDLEVDRLDDTLEALAGAAGVGPAETHVLAAAVLVNLDDRIGRAVGLLHDDVSRTRPSAGLLCRLLEDVAPRAAVLEAAGPGGALEHRGLVEITGAYGDPDAPLASREVALHPRVVAALLRGGALEDPDPAWTGVLALEDAVGGVFGTTIGAGSSRAGSDDGEEGEDGEGDVLRRLLDASVDGRVVGLLRVGADVEQALDPARAFAHAEGLGVLRVDLAAAQARGAAGDALLRAVRRESILAAALPVWTRLPSREALADPEAQRRLAHLLLAAPAPLLVHAEHWWTPPADLPLVLVQQQAAAPGFHDRRALWAAPDGATPPAG
ncbi:MAG TPA: hypothetical protein VHG91_20460, partial [Longimicrobium sp.]|nr:hypothetical protein [Longimicrobium sp.]